MDGEAARVATLLDRRTRALAARPAAAGSAMAEALRPMLVWGFAESLFATEIAAVAAVIPFAGCARVPTQETACLGVIGRSGRFYSVIDMRRLLGLAASGAEARHVLLLHGPAPYLALAVDQVLGRFDLAVGAASFLLEGSLVAPLASAELRARLGLFSPAANSLESIPS